VPPTAERLAAALADLPVVIDDVACASGAIPVPSYGGPRPTSIVTLSGAGRHGEGEHVGWTNAAHSDFARTLERWDLSGPWRLATLAHALRERGLDPYDRAAIEMAAIELALRQRGTTLATLAGVTPEPVRTVVSFERVADPAAEAARHPGVPLKVDVDAGWSEAVWRALGALGRVAILDWKGGGNVDAYTRALAFVPDAIHEDPLEPYPAGIAERVSLDAAITEPAALDRVAPYACNLKPARMGGVLDAIRAAARCERRDILAYVGGMFEVGIGRRQLRDLASVLCPDGPNDLAPIPLAETPTNP
jgi:L-alanine-DL-glutamate epimerase-like enolase superfamily enzyme